MATIIIGAGMAGLSAAYHLQRAGETVAVLEARHRPGGRTHTDTDLAGFPVEFGAELIHGDKVITWEWVRELGLHTLHWTKTGDSMVRMEDGRWLTMAEARRTSPDFDMTRAWNLPDIPAHKHENWGDYLKRIGFTDEQLRYVKRSFSNAMGDDMRFVSAARVLQRLRDIVVSGEGDFRILEGYGAIVHHLVHHLSQGQNIHYNTPVHTIEWGESGVKIAAVDGRTFEAEQAVVTIPLGVLQSGSVQFVPDLPAEKHDAMHGLRMGPVMKMIYVFNEPVMPPHINAIYSAHNPPMWWSPSYQRGLDIHVWTAFLSGDYAREMLELGEESALQKGLETLRTETDNPHLTPVKSHVVNWPQDPYAMGGYSVVTPGYENARSVLAAPTPPLYWAGEATASDHTAATVHGAYLSGQRAANEVLTRQNKAPD